MTPEREAPNDVEVAAAIERVRLLIANFRMNNLTVAALEIVCAAASRAPGPPREPTLPMISAGHRASGLAEDIWKRMYDAYTATGQTGGAT